MADNRYKMFRNFMFNELGITREDIESWTKEAIKEKLDSIKVPDDDVMANALANRIIGVYPTYLKAVVGDALLTKFEITVKEKNAPIN